MPLCHEFFMQNGWVPASSQVKARRSQIKHCSLSAVQVGSLYRKERPTNNKENHDDDDDVDDDDDDDDVDDDDINVPSTPTIMMAIMESTGKKHGWLDLQR